MLPSLASFKKKKILLLTHSGTDVDAIASASALFFALKQNNSVLIGVPEHISKSAKAFAENMKIKFEINPCLQGTDILVLLDFNSRHMLGNFSEQVKSFKGKIFLLDHHAKTRDNLASPQNSLIDESKISCTELVFEWLKKSKIPLTKQISDCIASGIIEDSSHFRIADKTTFSIMAECVQKSGKNFNDFFSLFKVAFDKSKKIALLKAAQRMQIFDANDLLIVLSEVGAFEADSATSLTGLGADIAFVGNCEKGILKISARANNYTLEKTGIDLAKNIMQPLSNFFEGNGGGHAGAAGFNGKSENIEEPLQKCLFLTIDFLKQQTHSIEAKKL